MILLFRHVNPVRPGPPLRSPFHASRAIKFRATCFAFHLPSLSLSTTARRTMTTITLKRTGDKVCLHAAQTCPSTDLFPRCPLWGKINLSGPMCIANMALYL